MALTLPVLALLDEPNYELQEHALRNLDDQVNEIWPQVADYISRIEELHEDPQFPARDVAALVAAKVYYNLGDSESAVRYALAAGGALDLSSSSEFVDTIIAKCTSLYIADRQAGREADQSIERIVEVMLENCVSSGDVALALGIALECRRLELVERFLREHASSDLVHFVLESAITLVTNRAFRTRTLRSLAAFVKSQPKIDHMALVKIVIQLNDDEMAVALFKGIDDQDMALQIAFDLVASASQELLDNTAAAFVHSSNPAHAKIVKVLSGVPTCDYEVTFLKRNNHVDITALNRTKTAFDSRNSMFHSAVSFQNAFLHVGTTSDGFFRNNIEWLGRASHWTKFTATAALGVIHRGNLTQGRRILQPYLPGGQGSVQSRGGSLYGLGLIFAGFGKEVQSYLLDVISDVEAEDQTDENDIVLHGASLGVGLAAMRTQNTQVYDKLRDVLYHDSAVAGEAVGLAMGLVMLGSHNQEAQEEMLGYARDTQHEKIQRSLVMGIALLNYACEEQADEVIANMMDDQEAILRYGGCFTIALAYAGTGSKKAIKMLLHSAVSDASNDVRRAAVIALGFVLLRNPTALPRMVELLSESYNPHVRYGTTMALGIACAGSALPAAVDVLEPMLKDPVDFVRQGAMIALAMILIQRTGEQQTPRVKAIREQFASVVSARHEDGMAKFGAALAQGIIDAGGCNCTIQVERPSTGNLNMKAVVGLAVGLQYWYWFPLTHFMSLAFTPTNITCVRGDLKIPELQMTCNAPSKLFDYPPHTREEDAKTTEGLVTAILSTTLKDKRKKKKHDSMEDEVPESKPKEREVKDKETKDLPPKESSKELPAKKFQLSNMSRVVPWQREYITLDSQRYRPVISRVKPSGVIVVADSEPEAETAVIKTQRQAHTKDDEDEEAPIPAPFVIELD